MDQGHRETDEALAKLERKLKLEYGKASSEMQKKLIAHWEKFKKQDEEYAKKVKDGDMAEEDYLAWRKSKLMQSKAWKDMRDVLTSDMNNANKIAIGIINNHIIDAYALNMNYGTYEIESGTNINTSFSLYDHATVENLVKEDPQIIPRARLDIPEDKRWNRNKLTSAITQGILTGESIPNIARRLRGVSDMNLHSAVRNARTYTTAAENKGRVDSYKRAEGLGIQLQQEWLATLDTRTRSSHRHLDGERVAVGEKFSNGCRYPGDPQGMPWEIYNCRCTLVAAIKGHDQSAAERFSRLPSGMTYDEWKNEIKQKQEAQKAIKFKEKEQNKKLLSSFPDETKTKGYVGLSGEESDEFMKKYHNKKIIGKKGMNTMDGSRSRRINGALRSGKRLNELNEDDMKFAEKLDAAIQKNEIPQDMTLFRGVPISAFDKTDAFKNFSKINVSMDDFELPDGRIDFDSWQKAYEKAEQENMSNILACGKTLIGNVISDDGYMQVSASSQRNIFGFSDVNIQLHAKAGTKAYISDYLNESEIILERGTSMQIIGAEIGEYIAENGNRKKVLQIIAEIVDSNT